MISLYAQLNEISDNPTPNTQHPQAKPFHKSTCLKFLWFVCGNCANWAKATTCHGMSRILRVFTSEIKRDHGLTVEGTECVQHVKKKDTVTMAIVEDQMCGNLFKIRTCAHGVRAMHMSWWWASMLFSYPQEIDHILWACVWCMVIHLCSRCLSFVSLCFSSVYIFFKKIKSKLICSHLHSILPSLLATREILLVKTRWWWLVIVVRCVLDIWPLFGASHFQTRIRTIPDEGAEAKRKRSKTHQNEIITRAHSSTHQETPQTTE